MPQDAVVIHLSACLSGPQLLGSFLSHVPPVACPHTVDTDTQAGDQIYRQKNQLERLPEAALGPIFRGPGLVSLSRPPDSILISPGRCPHRWFLDFTGSANLAAIAQCVDFWSQSRFQIPALTLSSCRTSNPVSPSLKWPAGPSSSFCCKN